MRVIRFDSGRRLHPPFPVSGGLSADYAASRLPESPEGRARFAASCDGSAVTRSVTTPEPDALAAHLRAVEEFQQAVLARLERIEAAVVG